jgi:NAD(P)-dependent dehydrogenase (short-subunit alcohol dehydrogenase family)
VAISGRDGARLREAATRLGATAIQGDVSIEADAVRMVSRTIEAFGDYNVLVNNAGIGIFAPLLETTADDMRRVWEVNVLGATIVARESARVLRPEEARRHHQHLIDVGPAWRSGKQRLCLHQVRPSRPQRSVAIRSSEPTISG